MLHAFMQNHAGPKNMCKKTKIKNRRRTELNGGVLESRILLGVVCLLIYKQLHMGLLQYKASKTSFLWLQATNLLGTPELYNIVTSRMLHGPCGAVHPSCACMVNGACSKGYPKTF
jgi:hypothetical protein